MNVGAEPHPTSQAGQGMNIRVGPNHYDPDRLVNLGAGTFGEVYLLNDGQALKVLYTPSESDRRHIMELCTTAQVLNTASLNAGLISVPQQEAYELPANSVCGFTMAALVHRAGDQVQAWPSLTKYRFDLGSNTFRVHDGFAFDNGTATRALLQVFQLLLALESRRLVFCDLSGDNVLFDPISQKPGIIDTDSFKHQNSESKSLGSPGFVDPRLLDLGRSGVGGYHFDAKSDIYAATVLAYLLLMGVMPNSVPTNPPMSPEDMARQRLSWGRYLSQGASPFAAAGHNVVQNQVTTMVAQRSKNLQDAARKFSDLSILLAHFDSIFVLGSRENPVLSLSHTDNRSPRAQPLDEINNDTVLEDLRVKYGLKQKRKAAPRQEQPDPAHLKVFLAERGIRLAQLQEGA